MPTGQRFACRRRPYEVFLGRRYAAFGWLGAGEACGEVGARGDVQLLEDVREARLDCPSCDVELLGDLRVAVALRGQRGDSVLGRSERGDAGDCAATGSGADGAEFVAGPVSEQAHAAALGEVERTA